MTPVAPTVMHLTASGTTYQLHWSRDKLQWHGRYGNGSTLAVYPNAGVWHLESDGWTFVAPMVGDITKAFIVKFGESLILTG
jgi:hypothetical protein